MSDFDDKEIRCWKAIDVLKDNHPVIGVEKEDYLAIEHGCQAYQVRIAELEAEARGLRWRVEKRMGEGYFEADWDGDDVPTKDYCEGWNDARDAVLAILRGEDEKGT